MKMSWSGEDRPSSPVAPMPDETQWSPKLATVWASGQHEPKPALRYPPRRSARLRIVKQRLTRRVAPGPRFPALTWEYRDQTGVGYELSLIHISEPTRRSPIS